MAGWDSKVSCTIVPSRQVNSENCFPEIDVTQKEVQGIIQSAIGSLCEQAIRHRREMPRGGQRKLFRLNVEARDRCDCAENWCDCGEALLPAITPCLNLCFRPFAEVRLRVFDDGCGPTAIGR
jgi:hypothetical protein